MYKEQHKWNDQIKWGLRAHTDDLQVIIGYWKEKWVDK